MSLLVTDLGNNIEDKEAILQEVHKFYTSYSSLQAIAR